jgi:hypothetical protein
MIKNSGSPPMTIEGPVVGQTLGTFLMVFGLNNRQMCELFSIQPGSINKVLSSPNPVSPEIAILLRMYLRFPDLIPRKPNFDMVNYFNTYGHKYVRERTFATAFGVDAGRSYGWLKKGQNASTRATDLGNLINALGPEGYLMLFREARKEAAARGVNPFLTGSWSEVVPEGASALHFNEADLLKELPRGRAARRPGSIGMAPSPAKQRRRAVRAKVSQ